VASGKNRPLVERRFHPDEEAQVQALHVLISSVNKARTAAARSGLKTLAAKETDDESSAKASLP
jgi:hypothetical protein